jgi:hypothetical protein
LLSKTSLRIAVSVLVAAFCFIIAGELQDAWLRHVVVKSGLRTASAILLTEDLTKWLARVPYAPKITGWKRLDGDILRRFPAAVVLYGGGCSQKAATLVTILQLYQVNARKLLIGIDGGISAHVVAEVQIQGRWVVADALYGVVYRRLDGTFASFGDLQRSDDLVSANMERQKEIADPYPLQIYNYHRSLHFYWLRNEASFWVFRTLERHVNVDEWAPPRWLYEPFGTAWRMLLASGTILIGIHFLARRAVVTHMWLRQRHGSPSENNRMQEPRGDTGSTT